MTPVPHFSGLRQGFTFVGRQLRLHIDQTWYRVDLLSFHSKLSCLVIIDLKLSSLTHADMGQMHMYCMLRIMGPTRTRTRQLAGSCALTRAMLWCEMRWTACRPR